MIYSREVHFDQGCPSIDEVTHRIRLRTGIQTIYLSDKWLLVNPFDQEDIFSLYQEDQSIVLTSEGATTDLLIATLYTLLEMGGYYTDWSN
ncbi:MAG: hypothetical protein EOO61_01240 [Hymenobacter sp.]|nr:MAG: hypothetical protein EOO61_01240 [Hymenobacter sp.]